jgi:hypothetical protein
MANGDTLMDSMQMQELTEKPSEPISEEPSEPLLEEPSEQTSEDKQRTNISDKNRRQSIIPPSHLPKLIDNKKSSDVESNSSENEDENAFDQFI